MPYIEKSLEGPEMMHSLREDKVNDPEGEYLYLTFGTDIGAILGLPDQGTDQAQYDDDNNRTTIPRSVTRYQDPQSWTNTRKAFVTWLGCLSTFFTTYTPGAYTAGLPQYQTEWGVSRTEVYVGITVFTLCFAIAPMFLASFSELSGRRPLFLAAGVVYVASQLGSGLVPSFGGLLAIRAVAGISCSVFSTVVGGVISDIYAAKDRNTPMAIFTGAALAGTGIGPMVSGVITEHITWRWIYYLQTITCGLMVLALFLFFPETRGSVLLSKKAKALNAWLEEREKTQFPIQEKEIDTTETETETDSYLQRPPQNRIRFKVKADEERATMTIMIKTSCLRPITLLFTESVVFWFSMWMSFAWTILYLTFIAVPQILTRVYGFGPQANGLASLAITAAAVLGTIAAIFQDSWSGKLVNFDRFTVAGHLQPEARLVFSCGQCLFLPIGLFWLAGTADPDVHWIVPIISVSCLTLGIFSVYLAVFNYLADTYHEYASSAIAAQSFSRNVFAACLPLAAGPMLDALGVVGMGCLLGGVCLLLSAVPWVLVMWGPRIRARSKLLSPLVAE